MRALLLSATPGGDAAGGAEDVHALARALVAAGDRVAVLGVDPGRPGAVRRVEERGFEVLYLGGASGEAELFGALFALVTAFKPDVAHAFALEPVLARALGVLELLGVPLLHSAWGRGSAAQLFAGSAGLLARRRLCARFARVLAPDDQVEAELVEAGVEPGRVVRVAPGAAPWGASPPPGFDDAAAPLQRAWAEVLLERPRPVLPAVGRLVAVVLADRPLPQTQAALDALAQGRRVPDATLVVDDASRDGSAAFLRAHPGVHRVLELERPRGLAAAANLGLSQALHLGADRVLFLSGGAQVLEGTVLALEAALDRAPGLGLVGPVLRDKADPAAVVSGGLGWSPRSGRVRPLGKGEPFRGAPEWELRQVDGLASELLLFSRAALEQGGLFDEACLPGFAALDLCLRLRGKALGVACVPAASALRAADPGASRAASRRDLEVRDQLRLAGRHAPRARLPSLLRGAAIVASSASQVLASGAPGRPRALFQLLTLPFGWVDRGGMVKSADRWG